MRGVRNSCSTSSWRVVPHDPLRELILPGETRAPSDAGYPSDDRRARREGETTGYWGGMLQSACTLKGG